MENLCYENGKGYCFVNLIDQEIGKCGWGGFKFVFKLTFIKMLMQYRFN